MDFPESDQAIAGKSIVIFDAHCILCSANAQFILRHDHEKNFLLASMQGEFGSQLYRQFGIDPEDPESLILVRGDEMIRDSDAVIAIYVGLGWPWRLVAVAKLIPSILRDPLYRMIARNRYRLFGKRDQCWLPDEKFIDRLL